MRRTMPPVKVPNETNAELRETKRCLSIVSRTFEDASSADWSAKAGCGNVLTGTLGSAEVDGMAAMLEADVAEETNNAAGEGT